MTSTKYDCSQGSATVGRWEGMWSKVGDQYAKGTLQLLLWLEEYVGS